MKFESKSDVNANACAILLNGNITSMNENLYVYDEQP